MRKVVTIGNSDLSRETFPINMLTVLKPSSGHDRKHVLRLL